MGKVYTCFQNETAQKLYPLGWHIPMWHRRVAPLDVMLDAWYNDIQLKEECFMGMLRVSQISLVKKRHSLAWTVPHSLVMLLKCPTDIRWDRPWLRILAGTQMYHFIPSSWHETEIKEFSLCLKLIMTKWFTCRLTFLVASTGSVFLQHLRAIFIAWYWTRVYSGLTRENERLYVSL